MYLHRYSDGSTEKPFKNMKVGDVVMIGFDKKYCKKYAHKYGRNNRKKFTTEIIDGILRVERIK